MGKNKNASNSVANLNDASLSRPKTPTLSAFDVMDQLTNTYKNKIRPIEETYAFDKFHSPCLTDSDLSAKPMVLLMGQYSVGKTTFISHLLGKPYPGAHIGPEPTVNYHHG